MKRLSAALAILVVIGCSSLPPHSPPDYSRPAIVTLPADVPAFDHSKPLVLPWWKTAPILRKQYDMRYFPQAQR